jgi:hypothetical protein
VTAVAARATVDITIPRITERARPNLCTIHGTNGAMQIIPREPIAVFAPIIVSDTPRFSRIRENKGITPPTARPTAKLLR